MTNATDIILEHSKGTISLEEANKQLAAIGSDLHLDPHKNRISGAEMAKTHSDGTPEGTSGWGFMNHGIGTPEKMHVEKGKLDYDTGFGIGEHDPSATLYIAGYVFDVVGDHIEVRNEG